MVTRTRITSNLREQLIFYGSYHNNGMNQILHFVFVPIILWTVSVWLAYTPALCCSRDDDQLSDSACDVVHQGMVLNGSFFLILVPYSLYYIVLDVVAGVSWSVCVGVPIWVTSELFQKSFAETAWMWALAAHLFSWMVQIVIGHMYYEHRKPALMDSLFQSLLLAPLFVWFELLFLLGYKRRLYTDVSLAVQDELSRLTDGEGYAMRGTHEESLIDTDTDTDDGKG